MNRMMTWTATLLLGVALGLAVVGHLLAAVIVSLVVTAIGFNMTGLGR